MVALVIGQSHAANFVGERFESEGAVFNAWNGNCFVARDPLLGGRVCVWKRLDSHRQHAREHGRLRHGDHRPGC
jgi:hypothetical protein